MPSLKRIEVSMSSQCQSNVRRQRCPHNIQWSTDMKWARESPNETAETHPCYVQKLDDDGGRLECDDGMVWVKWSSNGLVARIPKSHVSTSLPPRSARRRAGTTAAAKLSEDSTYSTCSCCKMVSTSKHGKKSCTSKNHNTQNATPKRRRTIPVNNDDDNCSINNDSPLTKFLVSGVNSARNSSSHKRQLILEEDPEAKRRKKNPLSRFLVQGVDSTKNSSPQRHSDIMSISSQRNNANNKNAIIADSNGEEDAAVMGNNVKKESLGSTAIAVPSSSEIAHANYDTSTTDNSGLLHNVKKEEEQEDESVEYGYDTA